MIIQEIKERKKKLGMTNRELAERSGVPLSTVAKVLGGTTLRPRIDTIRALEAVLGGEAGYDTARLIQQEGAAMEARNIPRKGDLCGHEIRMGDEAYSVESIKKRSGGIRAPLHTVEDYLALPDECRVEMIDGRFYDLAAPGGIHQQIVMRLWKKLDNCIEEHGMPCTAQASPFDVQLDDYTIVQPDVMVFCRDPLQVYSDRATAAPDLVIEVLSKSTAFRDRHLKLFKYQKVWKYFFLRRTEKSRKDILLTIRCLFIFPTAAAVLTLRTYTGNLLIIFRKIFMPVPFCCG